MITKEKPPLNEDLLIHYGIPGMRWGHRKPEEVGPGRQPARFHIPNVAQNVRARLPMRSAPRPAAKPTVKPANNHATAKKVAIGVGIAAGLAAGAYFLSKTGTRPSARAMTGASNRAGLKAVTSILKTSGKISIKTLKTAPKVAKVGGKATFKTGKFASKIVYKGSKTVGQNSAKTVVSTYKKLTASKAPVKTVKSGTEVLGNLLAGSYGSAMSNPGGVLKNVRRKRQSDQASSG